MVRIQKSSACAHCGSRGACSISKRDMLIEVPNDLKAGVGDEVEVYMLPIMALLAGAFLGTSIGKTLHMNTSLAAIVGGVIFLGIAFYGLMVFDRTRKADNRYSPRMTRVLISAASLQPGGSR